LIIVDDFSTRAVVERVLPSKMRFDINILKSDECQHHITQQKVGDIFEN
jgi:hypothetical protein